MKAKQSKQLTPEELQKQLKDVMDKLNLGRKFPAPRPAIQPFDTHPDKQAQPHVCPNCGHCPTCGRRDIMPRRPLPWEYRPDPYFERYTSAPFYKWQRPDIVMCVG